MEFALALLLVKNVNTILKITLMNGVVSVGLSVIRLTMLCLKMAGNGKQVGEEKLKIWRNPRK